jgi:hypothetical protein
VARLGVTLSVRVLRGEEVRLPEGCGLRIAPFWRIRGEGGMPRGPRTGHRYREWRKAVFRHYGRTCHLCGHGGANDADHVNPLARKHDDHTDYRTGRPAHGVAGCPVCKRKCNQEKGDTPIKDAFERPLD